MMEKRSYALQRMVSISVSLPFELVQEIEGFAADNRLHRSSALAYLVRQGLARIKEMEARYAEAER